MAETYEQDQSKWGTIEGSGLSRVYVSRPGDTLESVAAFFYGDPIHRARIVEENPDWERYQTGAAVPAGTRLKVSEDASKGDAVAG